MANFKRDGWGPVTLYVREDDAGYWDKLHTIAKRERRSFSLIVSYAVIDYVKEYWRKDAALRKLNAAENPPDNT